MKGEQESSLELLLDTMCNTFGGVMFIAISLVVIISMTSTNSSEEEKSPASAEELNAVIAGLRVQLEDISREQMALAEIDATMNADPRLKQLSEIAALEATLEKLELKTNVEQQALSVARLALEETQRKAQENLAQGQKMREELTQEETRRQELEQALDTLRHQQTVSDLKMVFTTLTARNEMPYYVILMEGKAWRVGPDDPSDLTVPNDDVTYTVTGRGDVSRVKCAPRPQSGVPVLAGKALSAEMRQLLAGIPRGRVPSFMVPPSGAETMYELREILKQENVFHGFVLCGDDRNFLYSTGRREEQYEY